MASSDTSYQILEPFNQECLAYLLCDNANHALHIAPLALAATAAMNTRFRFKIILLNQRLNSVILKRKR